MTTFKMGKYKPYVWKGINKWGQKATGVIVAEEDAAAEHEARTLGITIHYLQQRSLWMLPGKADRKIKIIDIVFIMRQLSTLLTAGVPLVHSLEIISSGAEKVKLRAMLLTIRDDIANGRTFAEAITPYPQFFNALICGLINSGEQSGTLDKMVNEVANYLEYHEYLKSRIKRALYYPITVLSVAIIVCISMLVFLVPRFEKIYASFNAKLPGFTLAVVSLSHHLRENWWLILIVLAVIFYLFRQLRQTSNGFNRFLDRLAIRIILFGPIVQKAIISRICSTLSITLVAGIPLIDALNRVAKVANNQLFRDALLQTREQVVQGESISLAMRGTLMFPPMVSQMVEIGEKSGSLDHMLSKVGEYYREQVDSSVEGLTTLIEPLLIVTIGIIVGIFVFAMYLPIFNLGLVIK
ncbi:MAG: hypothetical protein A3F13_04615 [Gammaproteobacteria bacterium RIFCSPHIGHO2_12_FULL_40_19]|nr:MAG: hypothetical protein A3F13_04615 [Gammaproteobacteria bacterium RIFCSPHIGHO2_12_FULL_40_19]